MNAILRTLPVRMVLEAGKSSMPPTKSFALSCRPGTRLAKKLNANEHQSYEVRICYYQ